MTKKNANPLTTTITLPLRPSASERTPAVAEDADLRQAYPAYVRAGKCLINILKHEINADMTPSLFAKYATVEAVLNVFRSQFMSYARGDLPFTQSRVVKAPMAYWKDLQHNPNVCIVAVRIACYHRRRIAIDIFFDQHLGIKLFSIVPNSMAEERTMPDFTKLNSPDRASQKNLSKRH